MEAASLIKDFKARIDPEIRAYFGDLKDQPDYQDKLIREALDHLEDLVLSGGKRLRAALMYYAYLGAGGTEREAMLKTSMSVEFIHMFLLVHDDIMDRDAIRHGVPTLHERYAKLAERNFPGRDAGHFGNSIALILGDMLYAFGNDIIFRAPFEKERIFQALSCLQHIVSHTVIGQARDVYMEYRQEATMEEILSMYENKTARYSIEGPLHLGMYLAGGDESLKDLLSAYAIPFGKSYQIQDDILGVFGDTGDMGKPVGSDIQEGKYTLLVERALALGSSADGKRIREILKLGDALTEEGIEEFRSLIERTGGLGAARDIAARYGDEGRAALSVLRERLAPEGSEFLEALAGYILTRNH